MVKKFNFASISTLTRKNKKIFQRKTFHVLPQHIKIGDSEKSVVSILNWGEEGGAQNPFS